MSQEIVRKFRKQIPEAHRASLDTRLRWLWVQRFGTVQTVWKESPDLLDRTACTNSHRSRVSRLARCASGICLRNLRTISLTVVTTLTHAQGSP